jgi:hypothetical protein
MCNSMGIMSYRSTSARSLSQLLLSALDAKIFVIFGLELDTVSLRQDTVSSSKPKITKIFASRALSNNCDKLRAEVVNI